MGKHCRSCRQAFPSFDDHLTCVNCRFIAGTCRLDANNPCSACESWLARTWGKLRKSLRDARTKAARRGTHWTCNVPSLQTWMETASTSLDLISEVSSLDDSDIRNLDFDDSVNVRANTQSVEVSVHLEPVKATSAILVSEQAPTMDILVNAPHC